MSVLPTTIEERKNVPCIEYGEIFKTKVVDLDHIVTAMRKERAEQGKSNLIEVKAIRTKREKEISKVIKYVKDPASGFYYGIVIGTFDDGNVKWRAIYLTDYNTFDLDNDYEARCFVVLRMHPATEGGPIVTTEEPLFRIIDPDQVADESFSQAMLVKTALHKVSIMSQRNVEPFARYLELPVASTSTVKIIKTQLADLAISNPRRLLDAFDDKNRPLFEMIAMAKKLGIIKYDVDRGNMFAGKFIGFTMPETARIIETEELILARIRQKLIEAGVETEVEEPKSSKKSKND